MGRRHGHTPKYSLERIQQLVAVGSRCVHVTKSALAGARGLYLTLDDIVECVLGLTEDGYEQTLASTEVPDTFQDVYKPRFHGFEIYLKMRMIENREALIVSFKRNASP
jgi:hypothetical protein